MAEGAVFSMCGPAYGKSDVVDQGRHIVAVYAKDEDYLDGALFFAEQGIRRKEKVFLVTDTFPSEAVADHLKGSGRFDVQKAVDTGQIRFLHFREAYLYEGRFEPQRIFELIRWASAQSLEEGFSGIRVLSEMSHALCDAVGPEGLVEYEARANLHIPGCACTAVCQYDRRRFEPRLLLDLFSIHPYVAVDRHVYENRFFLAPEECLEGNLHQAILDRLIGSVMSVKLPERRLEREWDLTRELLESIPAFCVALDGEGRTVFANRTMLDRLGYTLQEVEGKGYLETFVPPEERASVAEELKLLAASEGHRKGRSRVLSRDGREFLVEWYGKRVVAEDGSPGFLFCIGLTVSESMGMREAVPERTLRGSDRTYRTVFETTGTAMFIIGRDGTLTDVNQTAERMLGRTREEMVRRCRYTDFLHPEDARKVAESLSLLWRGEVNGPLQLEIRAGSGAKGFIPALATMSVSPGGEVGVVSLMDISKEKERERVLEEKAKQMRDLLAIASHELRHPLTLVQGYAAFLRKSGDSLDAESYDRALQGIQEGAGRLTRLVEGLLDVNLIERGVYPARRRPTDLRLVVEKVAEEFRVKERREIALDLRGELERVCLNPEMISQLLVILLENACKFSPSDTAVEVRGEGREGRVRISVLDRGIGVPSEERERIFELFYQVEKVMHHSIPGLGIGLYIARKIVEAHDGRIWHRDREGGGSEFTFEFPAEPPGSRDPRVP